MTLNNDNTSSMKQAWSNSFLFSGNAEYLDELYNLYLEDPSKVDAELRRYFDSLHKEATNESSHQAIQQYFKELAQHPRAIVVSSAVSDKQSQVNDLIRAYRTYGHKQAAIDPLGLAVKKEEGMLNPENYGLHSADLSETVSAGNFAKLGQTRLSNLLAVLKNKYTQHIGFETMHISSSAEREWLRERIEDVDFYKTISKEAKITLLNDLIAANEFENFLGKKYVGQKRFSLEGGDSLIPALNHIVNIGGGNPVEEIVIGMAHRGRLNVLANVIGKPIKNILREFDGLSEAELKAAIADPDQQLLSGDVKYHLGYSQDIKTPHGVTHLTLAFNPSHLEFVAPVVEGSVKARQIRRGEQGKQQVLPIVLHGDAAFAGQGVVLETINMSQLIGYDTGGTIHVVINNQVGFTTSTPRSLFSTEYCTDLARMLESPIFHVNSDAPEAVLFVAQLAYEYRMKFNKDVFIDLVCFRRHGHNEGDEPSATQPVMYRAIKKHPVTAEIYADQLKASGVITENDYKAYQQKYLDKVNAGATVPGIVEHYKMPFMVDWAPYLNQSLNQPADTRVPKNTLITLAKKLDAAVPEQFVFQPQVGKMFEKRKEMTEEKTPMNWGYAEMLAYLTLLDAGISVRLSGEDCQRGTFAHRHAVIHDYETGKTTTPINNIAGINTNMQVFNSFLSETGVLGFEYGYAGSEPKTLVIWEAQFGDFANGAQVIIDQFISSGEQKWSRYCGLVMFLPHGYEGMGPEHSSARLERYLQLCAEENMQVCVPTTPAQIFHLIRRQMIRPARKPLVVMTPKSLLRHPLAVSVMDDLADGSFQLVIPEIDNLPADAVTRVVLCSGKVYYDLLEKRRADSLNHVAIVRVEQLYPFPHQELAALLQTYENVTEVVWCQEEPKNQGAWYMIKERLLRCLTDKQGLSYAGRAASASPATGHSKLHKIQQEQLVEEALLARNMKD